MTPNMRFLEPEPAWVDPVGELDWPRRGAAARRRVVTFQGWALFPDSAVARVELWLGGHSLGRARLGLPRPDVRRLSRNPLGAAAGFELRTNLESWPGDDGEALLEIVATSIDGERFELLPVRLRVGSGPGPNAAVLPPPAARASVASRGRGVRTLVCTHQLQLGGAELHLVELLRDLMRLEAIDPVVVSAFDGPVREQLEELEVPVHISSLVPGWSLGSHLGRIDELRAWVEERDFEVALVNTSTALSLPGAAVAARLGMPAVWLIHESFEPAVLWSDFDPVVRERAEGILAGAAAAVFEAEATRRIYEPLIGPERTHTIPYGLDLARIDAERATVDRAKARRKVGIAPGADVMLCLGTVEPRKAQVLLAQAFDLIADRHPKAELLVVGGRGDAYAHAFEEVAAELANGDRIRLLGVTPDVHKWFGASDMLVCASDIESLPRTVMEAMAWEKPVLSTAIFGLPELISDGETGWLCEHSDVASLAAGLDRAFSSGPEERRRIARAAREQLVAEHDPQAYARRMAELIAEVSGDVAPTAGPGPG